MRRDPRRLFVEGGGDGNSSLRSECRKAFSKLLQAAGVQKKPRIVACGGRGAAWKQFRQAVEEGAERVWLLVDAEERVTSDDPWQHVQDRREDGWEKPLAATADQLQLMVVSMEAWLCADPDAFRAVLKTADVGKLPPPDSTLESIEKTRLFECLGKALSSTSKGTKRKRYSKGSHSFKILARVSPERLSALPWAKRFLDEMRSAAD